MASAEHTRAWRNRKKQQGLCPHCGKNSSSDGKRCSECQNVVIESNKGRFKQRYNNGFCGYCGKNPHETDKKSCSVCLKKRRDQYAACGDKKTRREQAAVIRHERKVRVLQQYGGRCVCCGEIEPIFLALDHIDGGGNEHRRQIGNNDGNRCGSSSTQFYIWVEKNNYPDILQVLCHNCNMGKHLNGGVCPHQTQTQKRSILIADDMSDNNKDDPCKPIMSTGILRTK